MPASIHRRLGVTADHDRERGHNHGSRRDESNELDPANRLQRLQGTENDHAEALRRVDPNARADMLTALQRTFGNGRVQRLIAGLAQRSSRIDRCGGMPCHSAQEDEGVRRVQRLGQSPEEIKAPRGASLATPAAPQRRDEEDARPHAHG